jgi:hypothetical protein
VLSNPDNSCTGQIVCHLFRTDRVLTTL